MFCDLYFPSVTLRHLSKWVYGGLDILCVKTFLWICMMSGFICGVNEVFAVLGCYAAFMVSQLPMFGKVCWS